jgi:predicted dehydrogenase
MDLAPHLIDLAAFLLDDDVVSFMAYVNPEKDENTIEIDSDAILQFRSGAVYP